MNYILQINNKNFGDNSYGNDNLSHSYLKFELKDLGTSWIGYSIEFGSQKHTISLEHNNLVFCKKDLLNFHKKLNKLLNQEIHSFRFEPIEPNFEITFTQSHLSNNIHLIFWLDNTNYLDNSYYAWDALGTRFYCTQQSLESVRTTLCEFISTI